MRPIPGGVYRVGPQMLFDLRSCRFGTHASNLGAILAHDLGDKRRHPKLHRRPGGR
jgi:butyrate kinase (EC 2.7.2.7)